MKNFANQKGSLLMEIIIAIGLSALVVPAFIFSYSAAKNGRIQQNQQLQAVSALGTIKEAVRDIQANDWNTTLCPFSNTATTFPLTCYLKVLTGTSQQFQLTTTDPGTLSQLNGFYNRVIINQVQRDSTGKVVASGGTIDPSTYALTVYISATQLTDPYVATCPTFGCYVQTYYISRALSSTVSVTKTTNTDFTASGYLTSDTRIVTTTPTPAGNADIILASNLAQWCAPTFTPLNPTPGQYGLQLPDGPPVAIAAYSDIAPTTGPTTPTLTPTPTVGVGTPTPTIKPDNLYVILAPSPTISTKLAHIQIDANGIGLNMLTPTPTTGLGTPTPTPRAGVVGIFTLDATKYSGYAATPGLSPTPGANYPGYGLYNCVTNTYQWGMTTGTSPTPTPLSIPNNTAAGVNASVTVVGLNGVVKDVKLSFLTGGTCNATAGNTAAGITHPNLGDLKIGLSAPAVGLSPTPTPILFVNRPNNGAGNSAADNICATIFDQTSDFYPVPNGTIVTTPTPVSGWSTTTGVAIGGNYAPQQNINSFFGRSPNGTWTLNVSDNSNTNATVGQLRKFQLDITTCGKNDTSSAFQTDNNFRTGAIVYYNSPGGRKYALVGTNIPNAEILVIDVTGDAGSVQDAAANPKIYKLKTFFNTRPFNGSTGDDHSPFNYGVTAITMNGTTGYLAEGGYIYAFDLTNIDTASTSASLPQIGCRIEAGSQIYNTSGTASYARGGADCRPSDNRTVKYDPSAATTQTDNYFGSINYGRGNGAGLTAQCRDGGNVEINGLNSLASVTVGTKKYVYAAVGADAVDEVSVIDVSTPPTINMDPGANSCGKGNGGAAGWKQIRNFDINAYSASTTEEAANSIAVNSTGTRLYLTSNGGLDAGGDGVPDSQQFYVLNLNSTTQAISFLSGSNTTQTGATSGYYGGPTPAHSQLFPRRSYTAFLPSNKVRTVLVGSDGVTDANDAAEYQVVNLDNEASPNMCTVNGGTGNLQFNTGFNDLTGLIEPDGDTYVYLIANSTVNQLYVVQGGPDANYVQNGIYSSPGVDITNTSGNNQILNKFYLSVPTLPANTTVKAIIGVADKVGGTCDHSQYTYVDKDGNACDFSGAPNYTSTCANPFTIANSTLSPSSGTLDGVTVNYLGGIPKFGTSTNYMNPGKCVKIKAWLQNTDALPLTTPRILEYKLFYTQ